MQQQLILGSIEHQFKCAILISAATHKISRNTLTEIFSRLGMVDCYIPFFKRKPIPHLWELFFAHSHPTTYNQFIQQYNCWTGLLEFTSQEDDNLIHQLLTGKTKWIYQNSKKYTSDAAASTNELSAIQKMLKSFLNTHGRSTKTAE